MGTRVHTLRSAPWVGAQSRSSLRRFAAAGCPHHPTPVPWLVSATAVPACYPVRPETTSQTALPVARFDPSVQRPEADMGIGKRLSNHYKKGGTAASPLPGWTGIGTYIHTARGRTRTSSRECFTSSCSFCVWAYVTPVMCVRVACFFASR